jgi:hypothetical protein
VRQWQQTGEDGGARRLADKVGGHAGGKSGAVAGQSIEMGGLEARVLETERVGTLLV